MRESVLNIFLEKNLIRSIEIIEKTPSKGKRALRTNGIGVVWVLNLTLIDGKSDTLVSARGGAREWASLDSLTHWLRKRGLNRYPISLRFGEKSS